MERVINFTASDLGRRYGCTGENIRQSATRKVYLDPTSYTESGSSLWSKEAVEAFEKYDPRGERWAARVIAKE